MLWVASLLQRVRHRYSHGVVPLARSPGDGNTHVVPAPFFPASEFGHLLQDP